MRKISLSVRNPPQFKGDGSSSVKSLKLFKRMLLKIVVYSADNYHNRILLYLSQKSVGIHKSALYICIFFVNKEYLRN